jgi:hypothetical protein
MFQRYHADKANGVKHTPLHTLQECCEEAGIDPRIFGRYAAQFPNAPQPVFNHAKNVARGAVKYYRKHEFVQWVNQVIKQKEKAMPDIKSALEKALSQTVNSWAADDEAHHKIEPQQEKTVTVSATAPTSTTEKKDGRIKSNVSRITFNFVRDNPGLNLEQVVERLSAQGFNANSVSALIYQMLRVRLFVADASGNLSAVVKEYVPIPSSLIRKKKPKAKTPPVVEATPARIPRVFDPAPKSKQVTLVNKRTGEIINARPAPAGIALLPTTNATPAVAWSVESVIGGLNVRQAMAVYDELRKIFGG